MFREMFGFLSCMFAAIGLFLVGCLVVIQFIQHNECERFQRLTGLQTSFGWSTSCFVKLDNGRWVTLEAYTKNVGDLTIRQKKD